MLGNFGNFNFVSTQETLKLDSGTELKTNYNSKINIEKITRSKADKRESDNKIFQPEIKN